ncbi:MAG: diaminopimelate epimerase [Legionellaceae bacterium]|nr:diaminopimelate epimerase [Legionellaceae bacterium]
MKFCKMHGLGNDFMVVDAIRQRVHFSVEQIQRLARRDIGVGFDQLLLLEASDRPDIDFRYRIFNANGVEVGQCGNGARCLARFIAWQGFSAQKCFRVATASTEMQLQLEQDGQVSVILPPPEFEPKAIPLEAAQRCDDYALTLAHGQVLRVHALSVGNPHAVLPTERLVELDLATIGRDISQHPLFPQQCNAGFMQIIDTSHLQLRVYERGCGETQACGSGAVAAAVVGRAFYGMAERIQVSLAGGDLWVHWPGEGQDIRMSGPATFVYQGELLDDRLL